MKYFIAKNHYFCSFEKRKLWFNHYCIKHIFHFTFSLKNCLLIYRFLRLFVHAVIEYTIIFLSFSLLYLYCHLVSCMLHTSLLVNERFTLLSANSFGVSFMHHWINGFMFCIFVVAIIINKAHNTFHVRIFVLEIISPPSLWLFIYASSYVCNIFFKNETEKLVSNN